MGFLLDLVFYSNHSLSMGQTDRRTDRSQHH